MIKQITYLIVDSHRKNYSVEGFSMFTINFLTEMFVKIFVQKVVKFLPSRKELFARFFFFFETKNECILLSQETNAYPNEIFVYEGQLLSLFSRNSVNKRYQRSSFFLTNSYFAIGVFYSNISNIDYSRLIWCCFISPVCCSSVLRIGLLSLIANLLNS